MERGEGEREKSTRGKEGGGEGGGANFLAAMSPPVNLSPWIVQMGVMWSTLPSPPPKPKPRHKNKDIFGAKSYF